MQTNTKRKRASDWEAEAYAKRQAVLDKIAQDPYIGYDSVEDALNDCKLSSQVEVFGRLLNGENLFISGPAGSGKTTIIKRFIELIDAQFDGCFNIEVTASTGLAASLINGKTIHSWSGLRVLDKPYNPKDKDIKLFSVWDKIKYTDVLIIDEISMLPAYYLDNVDAVCKKVKRNNKPFGGIQVVFLGDFLQLPPVAPRNPRDDMNYGYAITAESWKNADIKYCYMDKSHRASDKFLKYLLKTIETNKVNANTLKIIEACKNNTRNPNVTYTTLFTKNKNVDDYNNKELAKNTNPLKTYYALRGEGSEKNIDKLIKARNIPEKVELKVGATVIVTKNLHDKEGDLKATNGSVGKVVRMNSYSVDLQLNNGELVTINYAEYIESKKEVIENKVTGKVMEYEKIEAVVSQIPLKLGYAITVHKSQGQTLDAVEVDLSECFIPGLGYVALSRIRDAKNLIIKDFHNNALEVDKRSFKISTFVKQQALKSREEFVENILLYEGLVSDGLQRLIIWDDTKAGNVRKIRDKNNKKR